MYPTNVVQGGVAVPPAAIGSNTGGHEKSHRQEVQWQGQHTCMRTLCIHKKSAQLTVRFSFLVQTSKTPGPKAPPNTS